jgi:hypothetical protein
MLAGRGVGDLSNTDFGVGGVGPVSEEDAFACASFDLESGDDPACRSISLKDAPDPTVFPKALAIPLNELKALLDSVCELFGVVLTAAAVAAAAGVDGEPKAGWPNAETGFAAVPMVLVWPNTDPGVAGTGCLGADGCPPPKALTD